MGFPWFGCICAIFLWVTDVEAHARNRQMSKKQYQRLDRSSRELLESKGQRRRHMVIAVCDYLQPH